MRETWETLLKEPLVKDIRKVIARGLDHLSPGETPLISAYFRDGESAPDRNKIRAGLISLVLQEEPGRLATDPELGQATRFDLALLGATPETRMKSAAGRRAVAGAIARPANPIAESGVRKLPSAKQPDGGPEWGTIRRLYERLSARPVTSTAAAGDGDHDVPYDAAQNYTALAVSELNRGFFERATTKRHIKDLASLDNVTLFLGAGASADAGGPMHSELMPRLLGRYVGRQIKPPDDPRGAAVVASLASLYGPAYLGSIARELYHADGETNETLFAGQLTVELRGNRTTGGNLIRSVGALAFSFRHAACAVQVITTNYDDRLDEQQAHIHDYAPHLKAYKLRAVGGPGTPPHSSFDVPVYFVNGFAEEAPRHLVIGEADFFARYDHNNLPDTDVLTWRKDVVSQAMGNTACLFVGTSLSDPDVLAALATTKYRQPKYAIVLAPDLDEAADGSPLLTHKGARITHEAERRLVRDLVSRRFLHLGVTPIMVDFKHQVPQFLREVALRIEQGDATEDYGERLGKWWKRWAEQFGYQNWKQAGQRDPELQMEWMTALAAIRDDVYGALSIVPSEGDELLKVEVWVRNPQLRELFLWATSEGMWLNGATAHAFAIDDSGSRYPQQRAFASGSTDGSALDPRKGATSYHLSMPLVLHRQPWHHLPVGVVSILSTREPTRGNGINHLEQAAQSRETVLLLERLVKERVNDLLDPDVTRL